MLYLLETGSQSTSIAKTAMLSHLDDGHVGGAQETTRLVHPFLQDKVSKAAAELREHHAGKIGAVSTQGSNSVFGTIPRVHPYLLFIHQLTHFVCQMPALQNHLVRVYRLSNVYGIFLHIFFLIHHLLEVWAQVKVQR